MLSNTQVWKQVHLLDLAQLAVQGGLGHYGAIGGPDFFPNSRKVKSSRTWFFNVKAVMGVIVMEEVVELFSSEGNFFCKVIFRLLFNTKALLCLG